MEDFTAEELAAYVEVSEDDRTVTMWDGPDRGRIVAQFECPSLFGVWLGALLETLQDAGDKSELPPSSEGPGNAPALGEGTVKCQRCHRYYGRFGCFPDNCHDPACDQHALGPERYRRQLYESDRAAGRDTSWYDRSR